MKPGHLDKSSFKYLDYIYNHDLCTFSDLSSAMKKENITDLILPVAILTSFVNSEYIGILHSDSHYIVSYNLGAELATGKPLLVPEAKLFMLPEGSYLVEQYRQNRNAIWIPIFISAFSLLLSFIAVLR